MPVPVAVLARTVGDIADVRNPVSVAVVFRFAQIRYPVLITINQDALSEIAFIGYGIVVAIGYSDSADANDSILIDFWKIHVSPKRAPSSESDPEQPTAKTGREYRRGSIWSYGEYLGLKLH